MSQEYTPVDWVDETPGTPGTLINKARLDQMQTAHHYADGFEEVDTAPTADPGVDYHKVVYCTDDSTFYRWDGSAWVKDIDDDTKALLDAHIANHNNPHVVTKAQVGLGNADNTSDADKPISTATAAALAGKLDDTQLVSAWQGTPDNDHIPTEKLVKDSLDGKVPMTLKTSGVWFYAQVSSGTVQYQGTSGATGGITSVPMRDSSGRIKTAAPSANDDAANKKYVDDLGALKLDDTQLVTSWGGTPSDSSIPSEKLVKDSLDDKLDDSQLKTAWTSPVSDSNIPTEKLVKDSLDLKIDTSALVSAWQVTPDDAHIPSEKLVRTYIDTSLTDGSVTKIGTATVGSDLKPVYLNAGVPTAVANDLVDTATAQTIAGTKTFYATTFSSIKVKSNRATGNIGGLDFVNKDDTTTAQVYGHTSGSITLSIGTAAADAAIMALRQRAYNASNTNDVVTIGSLQASTDVMHTAGNEAVAGIKKFSNQCWMANIGREITRPINASAVGKWIRWCEFTSEYGSTNLIEMIGTNANNGLFYIMFTVAGGGGYSRYVSIINTGPNQAGFKIVVMRNDATTNHEIWIYAGQTATSNIAGGVKWGKSPTVINQEYNELPSSGYSSVTYMLGSA